MRLFSSGGAAMLRGPCPTLHPDARRVLSSTPFDRGMHRPPTHPVGAAACFGLMRRWRRARSDADNFLLNTRMSFRNLGAPTLAHYCDWSITDFGFHGDLGVQPRTIFVTPRYTHLHAFFKEYLPQVGAATRFVLVMGAVDLTVPRQVDRRAASFERTNVETWFESMVHDPRLVRWYANNVDAENCVIVPIPCGTSGRYGGCPSVRLAPFRAPVSLEGKPLRALCMHRIRVGPQWHRRRSVTAVACERWQDAVDVRSEVPLKQFFDTLKQYQFTICVSGGGLDPSPKAWVAMLAGSIPIIERSSIAPAYRNLPVAWVERWSPDCISRACLERWRADLRAQYEDPELRSRVVDQLGMGHWLREIAGNLPVRQGCASNESQLT